MSLFVSFEGPEGSGKSSQTVMLGDYLSSKGYKVHVTHEPGGTIIGDQIRDTLLSKKNTAMVTRAEILLFQASRAQLVEEVIRPKLAEGYIVLCDRYADSTIAYQGYGYQQKIDEVRTLVRYATGGLVPDMTLLLDVDVEVGLKRKTKNEAEWNRLDAYDLEFHQRVRAGYLEMAKQESGRWVVVDAGQEWEEVQESLRKCIHKKFRDEHYECN